MNKAVLKPYDLFQKNKRYCFAPCKPLSKLIIACDGAALPGKFYVQSRHACTCGFMDGINRVLQVSTAGIPFCHFLVQLSTVGFAYMYDFD
jgi:hypothetical protein